MRKLGTVLVLALALLVSCSRPREVVPVYHESSALAAQLAANLEAQQKGGAVHPISLESHSMAPTILPGDVVVAVPTPFSALRVGMIVDYLADWNGNRLTCHRLVGTWPNGTFIAEGDDKDNRAETPLTVKGAAHVGPENYVDHVVSIYRYP